MGSGFVHSPCTGSRCSKTCAEFAISIAAQFSAGVAGGIKKLFYISPRFAAFMRANSEAKFHDSTPQLTADLRSLNAPVPLSDMIRRADTAVHTDFAAFVVGRNLLTCLRAGIRAGGEDQVAGTRGILERGGSMMKTEWPWVSFANSTAGIDGAPYIQSKVTHRIPDLSTIEARRRAHSISSNTLEQSYKPLFCDRCPVQTSRRFLLSTARRTVYSQRERDSQRK